jgi:hypothetical protein
MFTKAAKLAIASVILWFVATGADAQRIDARNANHDIGKSMTGLCNA